MSKTKSELELLPVKSLVKLISKIEDNLPGWWWSISQSLDKITLSAGPSEYALYDADRAYAQTKEGDSGFHLTIKTQSEDDLAHALYDLFDNQIIKIKEIRESIINKGGDFPKYVGRCRKQSKDDLHMFKSSYGQLVRMLSDIRKAGLNLQEVYIGSCQLSVDVSLRGKDRMNKSFDISYDYQGNVNLAYSLKAALREIDGKLKVLA